jgi:hypothetical protein
MGDLNGCAAESPEWKVRQMGRSERAGKSRKTAEYLSAHKVDRKTGNCPLCHHLISNGTVHAAALCKPRRRVNATARPVFHVKQG